MSATKHTPGEYQVLLRMSASRRLLVEGSDDHRFFQIVMDQLDAQNLLEGDQPLIDSAETLIEFDEVMGNREKVEEICRNLENTELQDSVIGFVDRELRDFDLEPRILDAVNRHKLNGSVVWTRGHSVENYFFDIAILRSTFRDTLQESQSFSSAWEMFEGIFEGILRIACAASLVAFSFQETRLVLGSIDRSILRIDPPEICVVQDIWMKELSSRTKNGNLAEKVVDCFLEWEEKLTAANLDTVRWLCHGHIGIKLIREAFTKCVNQVSPAHPKRRLTVSNSTHFNLCAAELARSIERAGFEFLHELFLLLRISLRNARKTT